ncbi:hypothetical protein A9R05_41950 (plasmid) [Burkholderia sp. KK1]|nr:hypothetical protein [Burkholderia sp. M701]AQH05589.1 hypothetical protein A9R05_41950 [Burkholderia sp. KK1]
MMIIGTCHFESRVAADLYYRQYGYDGAELQIQEGSIRIGPPSIAAGERLSIIPGEGRYQIHCGTPDVASARASAATKKRQRASAGTHKRTLAAEIALLNVKEDCIVLPKEDLTHYADIKQLVEKSGGRYDRRRFRLPPGINAEEVLSALRSDTVTSRKQERQAFFTPVDQAHQVCRAVGEMAGKRVLEPSAGNGALADVALAAGARLVLVENDPVSIHVLRKKGYEVVERDFLELTPDDIGLFDAIVANPPFSRSRDITHVMHMFNFLKAGGCLSTIMSVAWKWSEDKRAVAFREFLSTHSAVVTDIEAGAFRKSGTAAATTHVCLRKPVVEERAAAPDVVKGNDREQFAFDFV